jgi:hypothetical protein
LVKTFSKQPHTTNSRLRVANAVDSGSTTREVYALFRGGVVHIKTISGCRSTIRESHTDALMEQLSLLGIPFPVTPLLA